MKSVFRDILLERDFERGLPYVRRERPYPDMPSKALSVIGIRRSGKTTYLRQIWDDLSTKDRLPAGRLVYVNFFDERLFDVKASQLQDLLEAHYELYPGQSAEEGIYFFLDEIQIVKGWEFFVDRLMRARHRVFVSGSSATLLSKEIASAMRGRSLSVEIFPFSFAEVLKAEKRNVGRAGPRERAALLRRSKEYLNQGGFPETLPVTPVLRRRILQDYQDAVLLRDIIERHNPSDPTAIAHMMRFLMNQVGGTYTINKTCEKLKALGFKVNKPEISAAMDWFHDSYLFFSVPVFDRSVQRRLINPRKLYCIDTGMAYHGGASLSEDRGRLLENAVFLHLRRQTEEIYYFKDSRRREVDFVVRTPARRSELIQVCWSLKDPRTRRRELDGLHAAMAVMSQKQATVVTLEEEETIRQQGHFIHVRPLWSYLLE